MSWFEEQLQNRENFDNADMADAIDSIVSAVMGVRLQEALSSDEIASSAIDEILKYYHCRLKETKLPSNLNSIEEKIEYCMRPFGIMNRTVTLEKGWYCHTIGAMLGTLAEDGSAVALIPSKLFGYKIVDIKSGKQISLNRKTEKLLDKEAECFYEPLPPKALTMGDMMKFMIRQMNISDIVMYFALLALSSALGLLSPLFTKWLFGDVLNSGNIRALLALAGFMICYTISKLCFDTFQALINARIGVKQNIAVQAAVMNRILSLPPAFFKNYSAGNLSQRANYVQSLCTTLFNAISMTGMTSLFSLIYIGQIFVFTPSLAVPSLLIVLTTFVLSLVTTFAQMKISGQKMGLNAQVSGMTYSTITGIQKIKLAGAEKRMFSRWARLYAQEAQLEYNPPIFLKLSGTISMAVSLVGTIVLYAIAVKNRVAVADYYAFNTAYGMVSAAFMSVSSITVSVATIRPTLKMGNPILTTLPEAYTQRENVTGLRGAIELTHVSFRYNESMPNVINDMSLRIAPGEYLAIVGSSGSGKSTLMRLLLGFETPQRGLITYDKKDITKLDISSLRRKIGVVLQDGKLSLGDIYSNIVISAPHLTVDDAWKAAEIASLADDIREMPMGMSTIVGEGLGGISGGQKQRLMIARAIAPSPKILMFDEATSALDNVTQKKITEAIDSLKCTRIVIANRLSTVKHAGRIICLDGGRIVESGTYDELMARDGFFAKLMKRQQLEV